MRELALKNRLADLGMKFEERYGVEIPTECDGFDTEYDMVRNHVAVTDFSFMQKFSVPEETGVDFLDSIFAGDVARVRFGRMLHTFLANDAGEIIADCYVVNNDEEFIILCESLIDDDSLLNVFNEHGAEEAGLKNLTDTHVLLGVDGYKSWSVVKDIFGADTLGLPYLSVEPYPFDGADEDVLFFRGGKTSEFGYLLMTDNKTGLKLFDSVLEKSKSYDGGLCGVNIHADLRLEGRFFNIFAEGLVVKNPLSLGLQWMIDFDKEEFIGFDVITKNREAGLTHKIIGIQGKKDDANFEIGTKIFHGEKVVAEISAVTYSPLLDSKVGLALFDIEYAYAGLEFSLKSTDGSKISTISMPPIIPKSLSLRLDEM